MFAFVEEGGIEEWYGGHFAQGSRQGIGVYGLFERYTYNPPEANPHRCFDYIAGGMISVLYIGYPIKT